jgi:hypothetical protein
MEGDRSGPRNLEALGPRLECSEPVAGALSLAGPDGGFDPIECRQEREERRRDLPCTAECLFRPSEPEFQQRQRPVGDLRGRDEAVRGGKLASRGRPAAACLLLTATSQDEREHCELIGDEVALLVLAPELQSLPRIPQGRRPAACPEIRIGETGKDVRQDTEEATGARPGSRRAHSLTDRLVVAQVDRSPPGEQPPSGIDGRHLISVIDLLRQHEAEPHGGRAEVAPAVCVEAEEELHEQGTRGVSSRDRLRAKAAISVEISRSPP